MSATPTRLADTFVALADTLVSGYDMLELLSRLTEACVELLPVDAAGVLLADEHGALQTVAASDEQAHLIELFQLQINDGPCPECYRIGASVASPDLDLDLDRWPDLVPRARAQGYRAVHAQPLRLRADTLGALNLFSRATGPIPDDDRRLAQALADMATISILRERALADRDQLTEQLQAALTSRLVIEQAKGILAERTGRDLAAAFGALRSHARRHQRRLSDIAGDVVAGHLDLPLSGADVDDGEERRSRRTR